MRAISIAEEFMRKELSKRKTWSKTRNSILCLCKDVFVSGLEKIKIK